MLSEHAAFKYKLTFGPILGCPIFSILCDRNANRSLWHFCWKNSAVKWFWVRIEHFFRGFSPFSLPSNAQAFQATFIQTTEQCKFIYNIYGSTPLDVSHCRHCAKGAEEYIFTSLPITQLANIIFCFWWRLCEFHLELVLAVLTIFFSSLIRSSSSPFKM